MKPIVYIRADGNSQIGLGHVIRCTALVEMLKDDFKCTFLIQKPSEFLINEIENAGADFIEIPETQNYISEAKEIAMKHIGKNCIVVLDGYNFDTEYQQIIKNAGCKLVCIDDMHDKHYVADVVINHAPGLQEKDFSKEVYTKLLLGLEYSLVKKVFREYNTQKVKINEFPKSILIIFGGADLYNLTQLYTEIIVSMNKFNKINIITGSAYNYLDQLEMFLIEKKEKNISHFHNVTAEKLKQIALVSDIAIAPSSTILFELLFLNLPVISGYYINNQKEIYKGFAELDLIFRMEDINEVSRFEQVLSDISVFDVNRIIMNLKNTFNHGIELNIKKEFDNL